MLQSHFNTEKKASPFFSILTATFNNEAGLKKTLESVKAQTFRDLEHIVIDGGSTDSSVSLLREFEGTYNLTWISEPDQGIADALNKGIRRAKGKYLIAIHANDRLSHPTTLQEIYPLLKDETNDVVCFPVILEHPALGQRVYAPEPLWKIRIKQVLPHQGSFIHRRLHEEIGDYNPDFSIALDYDFFYRAIMAGKKIATGRLPVTLMDATGVGSRAETRLRRRKENFQARFLHERNFFWRLIHRVAFGIRVQWPIMAQQYRGHT